MTDSGRSPLEFVKHLAERVSTVVTDREVRNAYRARTHLRALRKINPNVQVVGVADDGGTTYVQASDAVITPLLVSRGHFQRNDLLRGWAIAQRVAPRPGATVFVDVGANVGTTTLYAARTGAFTKIVSVEPSPDNLHVLNLNVLANGLADVVHVAAAACGGEPGTVELLQSSISAGDHRVRRSGDIPATHQTVVEVPQRTLDEILETAGVKPSDVALVWVDTQGHEPSVFAGGAGTVAGGAPFLVELWPEMYVQAGTLDGYLARLTGAFRGYIDLREPGEVEHPMGDLRGLVDRLLAERNGQTDLVLLPAS
jgi:FkbM family methyltransferase